MRNDGLMESLEYTYRAGEIERAKHTKTIFKIICFVHQMFLESTFIQVLKKD